MKTEQMMSETQSLQVHALYGVYHANGGLFGELAYVAGKVLGTTHCALCDITHGLVKEKPSFSACRTAFVAPLKTVHINEQTKDLAQFTAGRTPCVVAETSAGWLMLLTKADLEHCNHSVAVFISALEEALSPHQSV